MKKIIFITILSLVLVLNSLSAFVYAQTPEEHSFNIEKYAGTANFSLYVNDEGKLYSVGQNGAGQLGIGSTDDQLDLQFVMDNVSQVAASANHSFAVTKDNKLYAWGRDEYGQLGLAATGYNKDSKITVPTQVNVSFSVKKISCGQTHTVILDTQGNVWVAGGNRYGQLGSKYSNQVGGEFVKNSIVSTFVKLPNLDGRIIVDVATADYTTYLLTQDGNVLSFGDNTYGELGTNNSNKHPNDYALNVISLSEPITKISAMGCNAMVLTQSGKVYVWGSNNSGQLGLELDLSKRALQPMLLEITDGSNPDQSVVAKDILCGGITNVALSIDGKLYSFGANSTDAYSCGIASPKGIVAKPTQIVFYNWIDLQKMHSEGATEMELSIVPLTDEVIEVVVTGFVGGCGSRTFVKDSDGNTWSFGSNNSLQLSSGNSAVASAPVRSTLFRTTKYTVEQEVVDYLTGPIIVLCIIFAILVTYVILEEIRRYKLRHKKFY